MNKKKFLGISGTLAVIGIVIAVFQFYFYKSPLPQLTYQTSPLVTIKNTSQYIEGTFYWQINQPLNKKTLVRYMIPLDPKTKCPRISASNIVFYAPYNGDAKRIHKDFPFWHRYFASELGYTIFTLTIEANTEIINDRKKYYIFHESGWHDLIFEIKEHLEKEYALESRPLLIVGESSGGSLAQQMLISYPHKVAAAAWNGGSRYIPFKENLQIPIMALNTWGCYGIPATQKMKQDALKHNIHILNAESFPDWKKTGVFEHHAAGQFTYSLMQSFIQGIVNLRDKNNGIVPAYSQWPVSDIHDKGKLYFPSIQMKTTWNKLPTKAISAINSKSKELISFPVPPKEQMIILIVGNLGNDIRLKDSLYYFFQNNIIGNAILTTDDTTDDLSRITLALSELLKYRKWEKLPLIVIGKDFDGQLAVASVAKIADKRIKKVIVVNSELSSPIPEFSITDIIKNTNISLDYLYSNDAFQASFSPERIKYRKFVDKDWFVSLYDTISAP